jgi:hypothetical protein
MTYRRTFAVIVTIWSVLALFGCTRTTDVTKDEQVTSAPVRFVLQADDDARTILDKAVKVHGDKQALAQWRCGYVRYKTKGGVVPDLLGEVVVEDTFDLPGHFKRVTRSGMDGKEMLMTFVINDGKGWTKTGKEEAEPMENTFTEKPEHPYAAFCNLVVWAEGNPHLTKLDEKTFAGQEAIGLRIESKEMGEMDTYFSKKTGLMLYSRRLQPDTDPNKKVFVDCFRDDYQNVQGIMVPMHLKGTKEGKVILDMTLIEVKFADKFKEGTFAKP